MAESRVRIFLFTTTKPGAIIKLYYNHADRCHEKGSCPSSALFLSIEIPDYYIEEDLIVPPRKPKTGRFDLQKCLTGIQGLDEITLGGIPRERPTLVTGGRRLRKNAHRS